MRGTTLNYDIGINSQKAREDLEKLFDKLEKFERLLKRMKTDGVKWANSLSTAIRTKLSGAFDKVNASLKKFTLNLAKNSVSSIFTSLKIQLVGLAASFVQINSEAELLRARLTTVEGSVAGGEHAFQRMLGYATQMPFEVDAIVDSYAKFKAAGIKDAAKYTVILGDAVAAFGGKSENFKLAVVAIQQMIGKGVISMEEMRRQLAEQIPTAFTIMAREAGMSIGQLMDYISEGKAESVEFVNKLMTGFEKTYAGAAARMMDTFHGSIVKARQQWKLFMISIGDGNGAFASLRGVVDSVATALEGFRTSDAGKKIIDDLSASLTRMFDSMADPANMQRFFTSMIDYAKDALKVIAPMVEFFARFAGDKDNLSGWYDSRDLRAAGVDTEELDYTELYRYKDELLAIRQIAASISPTDFIKKSFTAEGRAEIVDRNELLAEYVAKLNEKITPPPVNFTISTVDAVEEIKTFEETAWDAISTTKSSFEAIRQGAQTSMIKLEKDITKAHMTVLKFTQLLKDKETEFAMEVFELDLSTASADEKLKMLTTKVREFKEEAKKIDISTDQGKDEYISKLESAKKLLKQTTYDRKKATDDEVAYAYRKWQASEAARTRDYGQSAKNRAATARLAYVEAWKSNKGQTTRDEDNFNANKRKQLIEIQDMMKEGYRLQKDEAVKRRDELQAESDQYTDVFTNATDMLAAFSVKNAEQLRQWQEALSAIKNTYDSIGASANNINSGQPTARASGGPVNKNSQYLVGEKGPELFVPNTSGNIVNNQSLRSSSNADRVVDINLSFNGSPPVTVRGNDQTVDQLNKLFSERERYAA